jgi:hypothetical protein
MLPTECDRPLKIPVGLEEMFEIQYWEYANSQNWLERRPRPSECIANSKLWDSYHVPLKEYVGTLGISEREQIYLQQFRIEAKESFCNYILGLAESEKKNALKNFKALAEEIETIVSH